MFYFFQSSDQLSYAFTQTIFEEINKLKINFLNNTLKNHNASFQSSFLDTTIDFYKLLTNMNEGNKCLPVCATKPYVNLEIKHEIDMSV